MPIAHPGLMRLLDYKRYDVELHDNWVWFEAPLRDKPSGNLMERAYQRLVSPMPGLARGGPARLALRLHLPEHGDRPLSRSRLDLEARRRRPAGTRDTALLYRHPDASLRTRLAQRVNRKVNTLVGDEDFDLVRTCRPGIESRGWEPGPLSGREAAIAWFADRIRAGPRGDDAPQPRPRSPSGARERILAAAVERIASDGIDDVRIARIAMDAGVSTSLVHYHFETREALLEQALDYSFELAGDVRIGDGEGDAPDHARTAGRDGRPVPAVPGRARARLDPLGRAVAARRAPPRAAPDRRAPLRAHAHLVRGGDRGRHGGGRVPRRARTPSASPTACSRCATASAFAPCSGDSRSSGRARRSGPSWPRSSGSTRADRMARRAFARPLRYRAGPLDVYDYLGVSTWARCRTAA